MAKTENRILIIPFCDAFLTLQLNVRLIERVVVCVCCGRFSPQSIARNLLQNIQRAVVDGMNGRIGLVLNLILVLSYASEIESGEGGIPRERIFKELGSRRTSQWNEERIDRYAMFGTVSSLMLIETNVSSGNVTGVAARRVRRGDMVALSVKSGETDAKEILGTVTSVLGDILTVRLPNGVTVDRYAKEVWLPSRKKLEELEDDGDNSSTSTSDDGLVEVRCKGGTVKVTNAQKEYLIKTFTKAVIATMTPAAVEVIVEDIERMPTSNANASEDAWTGEDLSAREDDYMSPYFRDTGGGLTYVDLDRLGISPSDLIRLRKERQMAMAQRGDFEAAEKAMELSAADLILQEKQKEIEIRVEEKKMERKQTCRFQCQKDNGRLRSFLTRSKRHDMCYTSENMAILDFATEYPELWPEKLGWKVDTETGNVSVPASLVDTYGEEISLEEAQDVLRSYLAVRVDVKCDAPDPQKVPMGTQFVESACETQVCSERAIAACRKVSPMCDSDSSGSPDNLLSPLRSCPFRCQHFKSGLAFGGTNSDCRVPVRSTTTDSAMPVLRHVPVYANLTCGGCMSKQCLARVPEECERAGRLITKDQNMSVEWSQCDVSESGRLEYLTSWSQIEKQKESEIKPDEYKQCTFECKQKGILGMPKTCKNEKQEPQYAAVMCARCGTAECTRHVQEICMEKRCDADLGVRYGNYLMSSAKEMKCTFGCMIEKTGLFSSKKPCLEEQAEVKEGDARPNANQTERKDDDDDDEYENGSEGNSDHSFRFRRRQFRKDDDPTSQGHRNRSGRRDVRVDVICFDCSSSECMGMVARKCVERDKRCNAKSTEKGQLRNEEPVLVPSGDNDDDDDDNGVDANIIKEDSGEEDGDTESDDDEDNIEEGEVALSVDPMSVEDEESEEQKAAMSAQRELEGRIAFDRWLHFAKVKSDCDSFPFCNHIPSPPPMLPAPLDLESPRANVKYGYVPTQHGAPFSYTWETSKLPIKKSERGSTEKSRRPGMVDGTKPTTITGITSASDSAIDFGHKFDVGYRPTEAEERPFTKAGPGGWGYQFNMYRPALGRIDLGVSADRKSEDTSSTYPDWLDPAGLEENWKLLSGEDGGGGTFDVFDSATKTVVKGRFSTDPDISENPIGDLPSAPYTTARRHETFIGGEGDVRKEKGGPLLKSIEWDKNMRDRDAIKPQAEAVRYLKNQGVLPDCETIKDRAEQAICIQREKEAKQIGARFREGPTAVRRRKNARVIGPR